MDTVELISHQSVSLERWIKMKNKIRWFGFFLGLFDKLAEEELTNDLLESVPENHIP